MRAVIWCVLGAAACGGGDPVATDGAATDGPVDTDTHTTPVTTPTEPIVDEFLQVGRSPVDLLVVVDNSKPMTDVQSQLGGAYGSLIQPYVDAGIDYHVGIVTTDVNAEHGHLHALPDDSLWFDSATPDAAAGFQAMVAVGQGGSAKTQGIAAAQLATDMVATPANAGFVRDEARLEILVVSTHDDTNDNLALADVVAAFHALKPDPIRVRFSAAVYYPDCTTCSGSSVPGAKYALLQAAMLGDAFDLDAATWASDLAAIPARNDLKTLEFPLSQAPDPATISVQIDPVDAEPFAPTEGTWIYKADLHAVVFATADELDYGATIAISYAPAP